MYSGFYTIASGILTRQREIDTIGNNLVNVQTPGYRQGRVVISGFEKELLTRQEAYGKRLLNQGKGTPAAVVSGELVSFEPGLVKQTGRMGDVAINGMGFYVVRSNEGETFLTRNGKFDVDEEGYLCLPSYGRVMGSGGPIQVGQAGFRVEADGTILDAEGNPLGALQILEPQDYNDLEQNERGLFIADGIQTRQAENYSLAQGSLEQSNVNMGQEMSYLIEAQRAYQTCSAAMQIVDAMNQKAVTQIAAL